MLNSIVSFLRAKAATAFSASYSAS